MQTFCAFALFFLAPAVAAFCGYLFVQAYF